MEVALRIGDVMTGDNRDEKLRYYKCFEHGKEYFPKQVFIFDFDAIDVLRKSCYPFDVSEISEDDYEMYTNNECKCKCKDVTIYWIDEHGKLVCEDCLNLSAI